MQFKEPLTPLGYEETVQVFGTEDCVAVGKRWRKVHIESVKTNGRCAFVHDGPDCDGHSLQLKAGANTNSDLRKWNFKKNIRSISPCTDKDLWRSKEDNPIQFVLYSQFGNRRYLKRFLVLREK